MPALLALLILPVAASSFTRESVAHGGLTRTYAVYAPSAPARGLAAVFVLHGGGVDGAQVRAYTGARLDALGERKGFLVVYPDAVGHYWNAGIEREFKAAREGVDDAGFLAAVAQRLVQERGVDPRRLYAVGVSNGACMAERLACDDAGCWAAVAALEGALGTDLAASCRPARPVSVLLVNGTADPIAPWQGHTVNYFLSQVGSRLNVPETTAKWVALDGCAERSEKTDLPDADPADGTRWRLMAWRRCRGGAEVLFYRVKGGGHTWPNGVEKAKFVVGRTSHDVDFEPLLWDFFARHPLPERR